MRRRRPVNGDAARSEEIATARRRSLVEGDSQLQGDLPPPAARDCAAGFISRLRQVCTRELYQVMLLQNYFGQPDLLRLNSTEDRFKLSAHLCEMGITLWLFLFLHRKTQEEKQ